MPCRNDMGYSTHYTENLEAMLCAITKVLVRQASFDAVLDAVDWAEAGVQRFEFDQWWGCHVQQDAERLKREAEQRNRDAFRRQALDKLSPAERAALGV